MRDQSRSLTLCLQGTLSLYDPDGQPVSIKNRGPRVLLAMLGSAKNMRHSRQHLESAIWSRVEIKQAQDSLRQALSSLKRQLGPDLRGHVQSDSEHIWLDDVTLAAIDTESTAHFFEDAPRDLGEPFDDWLRQEQSLFERNVERACEAETERQDHQASSVTKNPIVLPSASGSATYEGEEFGLSILPPRIGGDQLRASLFADLFLDGMVADFRSHGIVEPFDFRDLTSDQISESDRLPVLRHAIKCRVQVCDGSVYLTVSLQNAATWRVEWTQTYELHWNSKQKPPKSNIGDVLSDVIEHTQSSIIRTAQQKSWSRPPEALALHATAHQILGMSAEGQRKAREKLRAHALCERSGIAAAWYCFSFANTIGERDPGRAEVDLHNLDMECERAISLDPTNPISLALIGHVRGFVFRDLETATSLAQLARARGPNHALVFDLSAMNAVYRCNESEAFKYAARARRLGRFSPYRPIYESGYAISASIAGRHGEAVRVGRQVLKKIPRFQGLMRHMCASLACLGDQEEAYAMVRDIRQNDPEFEPGAISRPSYPLPSEASRTLVRTGFERLGLS